MRQRLEAFLADLSARGVKPSAVFGYRAALEPFEEFLGHFAQGTFGEAEVGRYLAQATGEGAAAQRLKNLETACRVYLTWCIEQRADLSLPDPAQAALSGTHDPAPEVAPSQDAGAGSSGQPAPPGARAVPEGGLPVSNLPPPQRGLGKTGMIVVCVLGAGFILAGGCMANQYQGARKQVRLADHIRVELRRTVMLDKEKLLARVMEVANKYEAVVKPENIRVGVNVLQQSQMGLLPTNEQLAMKEAMQKAAMRRDDAGIDHFIYVETYMKGEMPALFSNQPFEFEVRTVTGGGIVYQEDPSFM